MTVSSSNGRAETPPQRALNLPRNWNRLVLILAIEQQSSVDVSLLVVESLKILGHSGLGSTALVLSMKIPISLLLLLLLMMMMMLTVVVVMVENTPDIGTLWSGGQGGGHGLDEGNEHCGSSQLSRR